MASVGFALGFPLAYCLLPMALVFGLVLTFGFPVACGLLPVAYGLDFRYRYKMGSNQNPERLISLIRENLIRKSESGPVFGFCWQESNYPVQIDQFGRKDNSTAICSTWNTAEGSHNRSVYYPGSSMRKTPTTHQNRRENRLAASFLQTSDSRFIPLLPAWSRPEVSANGLPG